MATGAATLLTWTIRPPPARRMRGRTAWFTLTTPKKSTSNRRRASSGVVHSTAPEIPKPALFTTRSIRPASASMAATVRSTASASVISQASDVTPGTGAPCRDRAYALFRQPLRRGKAQAGGPSGHNCSFHRILSGKMGPLRAAAAPV